MKITKQDYRERAARVAAGEGSDDDRRLVELYAEEMSDQLYETLTEIPEPVDEPATPKLSTRGGKTR